MSKVEISCDQMAQKELNEAIKTIKQEIPFIDKKPYSHNIISIQLQLIDKKFGKDVVNNVIIDNHLRCYGWSTV